MTEPQDRCAYCGATLDPNYYFCTACATPYKQEEAVLPTVFRLRPTTGQRIAKQAPQVATLFWTYFSVVLGGGILVHFLVGESQPALSMLILDALLLVTTVLFSVAYWRSLLPQFRRPGFLTWEAWAGLAALVPLLALNYAYHTWLRDMAGVGDESFIAQLREDGLSEAVLVLSICIFPAVTEEIAFRGLLQHWLHVAVRPATAIVLAAALFSAMHFSILSAPYLFLVGCLLGWLRWRTESLWPPILAHFLHNLVVLAYLEG